jgi:steroid 5-alpha reductase family enzyme
MFAIITNNFSLLLNLIPLQFLADSMLNLWFYFSALWLLCSFVGFSTLADVFWPLAFLVVTWTCNAFYDFWALSYRHQVVTLLVTIWAVRLSTYVALKLTLKRGEHPTYKSQQRQYGVDFWWISYFSVFLFEMLQVLIFSLPMINILTHPTPVNEFTTYDMMGILCWTIGFYFEAVADYQLYTFLSIPANTNKTLKNGLWAMSRHPNYFGETMMWFGIFLMNLNYPNGIYLVFSPIFVAVMLNYLTGVNMIEPDMMERKPDYSAYTKYTPSFVPNFQPKEVMRPRPAAQPTGGQ